MDCADKQAATCLMALSNLPTTPIRPTRTTSRLSDDDGHQVLPFAPLTPVEVKQRQMQTMSSECGQATESYKLTAVKHGKPDRLTVVYTAESGKGTMEIPFERGESPRLFYRRRDLAARRMFHAHRATAFCSWRRSLVTIGVFDPRWVLFHKTKRQCRFAYKNAIQLVVTRLTCNRIHRKSLCRTCQKPQWRTACREPVHLFHVLPLPQCQDSNKLCDDHLMDFQPVAQPIDAQMWTSRIPRVKWV